MPYVQSKSPLLRTKPYEAGMSASERKAYNKKTGGNLKGPQPGIKDDSPMSMYGSPAKMNNSPMQMKGSWMSKHCSK